MRLPRIPLAVAAATIVTCCPAAAASAAGHVAPERTFLETPAPVTSTALATLPDGRAVAGYTIDAAAGDTTNALVRPAGGHFPARGQNLWRGAPGRNLTLLPGGPASAPLLAYFVQPQGTGIVGAPGVAPFTGDAFAATTTLLDAPPRSGHSPRLARCPDGSTLFALEEAFVADGRTRYRVIGGLRGPRGEDLGAAWYTGPAADDIFQDVAVSCDRPGRGLISQVTDVNGGAPPRRHRILVNEITSTGPSPVLDVMAADGAFAAAEARIAPDGRLWTMWSETMGSGVGSTYVATRAPGLLGAVGPRSVVDPGGATGRLFFGAGGSVHALTATFDSGLVAYGVRTAAAGTTTFGEPVPVAPAADQQAVVLDDHPDGLPRLLVFKWGATLGDTSTITVSGIPAAGSSDPARTVPSRDIRNLVFAHLPSGDLLLVTANEPAPSRFELRESGIDTGAPPTLTGITVPGAAVAGEPVPLQIDAADPLGIGEFAWSVDGRTLRDQDTTYAFPAPGTYTVTARAVDRAGNASELSRTVRVLDPRAVTPGTPEFDAHIPPREAPQPPGGTPVTGGPAPDRTAPALTATATRLKTKKGKRTTLAAAIDVSVASDEVAAADIELVGTLKKGRDKGTLVLRSAQLKALAAGKATSAKLKVPAGLAKLVGPLSVRITLTDEAGNRTTRTLKVKTITKPPAKRGKAK